MARQTLLYNEFATDIGNLSVLGDKDTVFRIDFGRFEANEEKWVQWGKRYFQDVSIVKDSSAFQQVEAELISYFTNGKQEFSFTYQLMGTPFQKQVWDALTGIPFGETKSYKDIAEAIENPKAVRAVGGAVNKNPMSIVIPCHRVIGADGKLVGFGGGLDKKEFLLEHEQAQLTLDLDY